MAIPTQPNTFVPRPFADAGNYTVVPDTTAISGRASYENGFPTETQLPLAGGGIAPNRLDFNGILNILSAALFWQQSGGQWTYNQTINYAVPSIAFYDGMLWWCVAENGPDSANGIHAPGTEADAEAYWQDLWSALREQSTGRGGGSGVPVGTVITYYGATPPEEFLACDGSTFSATEFPELYALLGRTTTPDLRGYFIRGYDTRSTVDPSGASRAIGSTQTDAFQGHYHELRGGVNLSADGKNYDRLSNGSGSSSTYWQARAVLADGTNGTPRTANETRPKNICLLYCIKHD